MGIVDAAVGEASTPRGTTTFSTGTPTVAVQRQASRQGSTRGRALLLFRKETCEEVATGVNHWSTLRIAAALRPAPKVMPYPEPRPEPEPEAPLRSFTRGERLQLRLKRLKARQEARGGLVTRLKRQPWMQWYFRLIESYAFWRIFPWFVSLSAILFANFVTLVYALRYFAFSPELTAAWLETMGISLGFSFGVVDFFVIVVRNNLSWTRGILSTRKYQVIEKLVIAPSVGLYKLAEKIVCNALC